MMKQKERFLKFKEILETEEMTRLLASQSNDIERWQVTQQIFDYLVNTDDIDTVRHGLQKGNLKFLNADEKEKELQISDQLFYTNHIENGFLYHGTSKENLQSIFRKGLCSLESLYKEKMLQEATEVNQLYRNIYNRNYENKKIMWDHVPVPISSKQRCNQIYFSPSMNVALFFARHDNEFLRIYLKNLIQGFQGNIQNIPWKDEEAIAQFLYQTIAATSVEVSPEEVQSFLHFYTTYGKNIKTSDIEEKAIILVPSNLSNYIETIKQEKKDSFYRSPYEKIANAFKYGEFIVQGSIPPSKIMAITIGKDHSLSLHSSQKKVKYKMNRK